MRGMHAQTGQPLDGIRHMHQSIESILTTRIGSRTRCRAFGSRLPDLLDAPAGPGLAVDLVAATAEALARWEPRLRLRRVQVDQTDIGGTTLGLDGVYLPDGRDVTLDGIVIR